MDEDNYTVETELNVEKKYNFPPEISVINYEGKILVVNSLGCNWLVFSEREFKIFSQLNDGLTIAEVLEKNDEDLVISTITQIEAKKFEKGKNKPDLNNNIYIYLTNNCNIRCKHCYMFSGDIIIDELPLDDWKRIIADFRNSGGNGITFTGGEVLVYKYFDEILEYAHSLGVSVTVLSNGILWTEERVNKDAEFIDEIQFSLDGYDRESYMSVRNYDGFENVMKAIELFSKTKSKISVAVTPLYDDIDTFVENFEKFAKDFIQRFPNVYLKMNMELLSGRNIQSDKEKNIDYQHKLELLTEKLYPNYFKKNFIFNYSEKKILSNCGFGEISLASNGDVYWCNRIFELKKFGNIHDFGFKKLFEISQKVKKMTGVEHCSACRKCEIRFICGGGCRIEFPGINDLRKYIDDDNNIWNNKCPAGKKEKLLHQMIESNEYFYEGID